MFINEFYYICSYRFCLVMAQEHNIQSDITVGCSNITQLQISKPENLPKTRQYRRRPYADLNKFDRSLETEHGSLMEDLTTVGRKFNTKSYHEEHHLDDDAQNPYDFVKSLNKSFIPGIGLGILVTSLFVLIWGASRLRKAVNVTDINSSNNSCNSRRSSSPTATTCYAASEHLTRLADPENRNRYLKLQATTTL